MNNSFKEIIEGLKELSRDVLHIFLFWIISIIFFVLLIIIFLSPLFIITFFFKGSVNFEFALFFSGGIYALVLYRHRKRILKILDKAISSIPIIRHDLKTKPFLSEISEGRIKDFIKNWLLFIIFFVVIILLRIMGVKF
jgi:hypothetical protein